MKRLLIAVPLILLLPAATAQAAEAAQAGPPPEAKAPEIKAP